MSYTMHHTLTRSVIRLCGITSLTVVQEGMDMLEKAKDKHVVAPGINWLIATLHDAEAVGSNVCMPTLSDPDSSATPTRRLNK